jgi:hypothetical protein
MLEQEGGCTLEELLCEDEHTVSQVKAANPKLTEYLCQRSTLQKLIEYATQTPSDPDSHEISKKFPFVAADILSQSKTVAQALLEGGWAVKAEEEEESGDDKKSDDDCENKMVRDILNNSNVRYITFLLTHTFCTGQLGS